MLPNGAPQSSQCVESGTKQSGHPSRTPSKVHASLLDTDSNKCWGNLYGKALVFSANCSVEMRCVNSCWSFELSVALLGLASAELGQLSVDCDVSELDLIRHACRMLTWMHIDFDFSCLPLPANPRQSFPVHKKWLESVFLRTWQYPRGLLAVTVHTHNTLCLRPALLYVQLRKMWHSLSVPL